MTNIRLVWSAPPDAGLLWAFWSLPMRMFLLYMIWLRGPKEGDK